MSTRRGRRSSASRPRSMERLTRVRREHPPGPESPTHAVRYRHRLVGAQGRWVHLPWRGRPRGCGFRNLPHVLQDALLDGARTIRFKSGSDPRIPLRTPLLSMRVGPPRSAGWPRPLPRLRDLRREVDHAKGAGEDTGRCGASGRRREAAGGGRAARPSSPT